MSRTYAHTPPAVVAQQVYGEPVYRGPRQDKGAPLRARGVPYMSDEQWHEFRKSWGQHPADSAGAKQQRRKMRRARHIADHLLSRDPQGYDDMPTTRERIDPWMLPTW